MDAQERDTALKNLLGYCRGRPTRLTNGRQLALALLGREWQGPEDDAALRKRMTQLLQENLYRCREHTGVKEPVVPDPEEHALVVARDAGRDAELKVWSVLWAYYVCGMEHEEIGKQCGWQKRTNNKILNEGRQKYITPIIVALEQEQRDTSEQALPVQVVYDNDRLNETLQQVVPAELHPQTLALARILVGVVTGSILPETGQARIRSNPLFTPLLKILVGQQITIGDMHLVFGEDSVPGSIAIKDIKQNQIVRLNVDFPSHYLEGAETVVANDAQKISLYVPSQTYTRFVGRSDKLDQIVEVLRSPRHQPVVSIVGLGGIGKTALAREVVQHIQYEQLFDYIVWTSAKLERFVGEKIIEMEAKDYNLNDLMDNIGRQCERIDITHMPTNQKDAAVKHLLATKRILIVMDNLDTVTISDHLINSMVEMLGRSKLLVTSRHHLKHDRVLSITLRGFPEDEGVTFLRQESKVRNIESVIESSHANLVEIHRVTGGAPLAMKLVVGQMGHQAAEVVLNKLKHASFKEQDYDFYRFVYWHSWQLLQDNAKMALVDMSVFPPVTGGAVVDVLAVSQVEQDVLWSAMDQLVLMSLVDKIGPAKQERFALHPLTHYFILSDITGEWGSTAS